MSADAEMLNFIYQNSQMGVETLNQLIPMIDNEAFKKRLEAQLKEYEQPRSSRNREGCTRRRPPSVYRRPPA